MHSGGLWKEINALADMVLSLRTFFYVYSNLETPFLELHDGGVVDASTLREDEDGQLVRVLNVLLQPDEDNNLVLNVPLVQVIDVLPQPDQHNGPRCAHSILSIYIVDTTLATKQ